MAKIEKLWFDANRIYLLTDAGETLSRPLEAFPVLKEASESERLDFKIGRFGDDYDVVEPNPDNEVARIFGRFPQINVSEMAKYIGINKSLLAKYIYGIKNPSSKRMQEIKQAFHLMGQELIAI